jgi:hypothetical protein
MPTDSRTESELSLPKDLLAELQLRGPARGKDFHIEGWKKPSLVDRMFGFLDRDRSRE